MCERQVEQDYLELQCFAPKNPEKIAGFIKISHTDNELKKADRLRVERSTADRKPLHNEASAGFKCDRQKMFILSSHGIDGYGLFTECSQV